MQPSPHTRTTRPSGAAPGRRALSRAALVALLVVAPALAACGEEETSSLDDQCALLESTQEREALDCPEEQ